MRKFYKKQVLNTLFCVQKSRFCENQNPWKKSIIETVLYRERPRGYLHLRDVFSLCMGYPLVRVTRKILEKRFWRQVFSFLRILRRSLLFLYFYDSINQKYNSDHLNMTNICESTRPYIEEITQTLLLQNRRTKVPDTETISKELLRQLQL